jgi:hypothetical protein
MGDNPLGRVSQRRRRAQLMSKMSAHDRVEGFIARKQCFMKPSNQRASSTENALKDCTNVAGQLHVLGSSRKGLVASPINYITIQNKQALYHYGPQREEQIGLAKSARVRGPSKNYRARSGADQHPGPGAVQSGARGNMIRVEADQRREPHGAPGADQRRWSSGRAGRPGCRVVRRNKQQ